VQSLHGSGEAASWPALVSQVEQELEQGGVAVVGVSTAQTQSPA